MGAGGISRAGHSSARFARRRQLYSVLTSGSDSFTASVARATWRLSRFNSLLLIRRPNRLGLRAELSR